MRSRHSAGRLHPEVGQDLPLVTPKKVENRSWVRRADRGHEAEVSAGRESVANVLVRSEVIGICWSRYTDHIRSPLAS